jgi:hypothetical protein
MPENFYGYPLEDREKEDIGEMYQPDQMKPDNPLKQIKGKPLDPKKPPTHGKKF